MSRAARILVVDDFAAWRDQFRSLLKACPGGNIVGEAPGGQEAIEKAIQMQPDIILLDIGMPVLNEIEAAEIIHQRCPQSKLLFVTQEGDAELRNAAMRQVRRAMWSRQMWPMIFWTPALPPCSAEPQIRKRN